MSDDTEERQLFEAWAEMHYLDVSQAPWWGYTHPTTDIAWMAWRASARTPRPEREVKP